MWMVIEEHHHSAEHTQYTHCHGQSHFIEINAPLFSSSADEKVVIGKIIKCDQNSAVWIDQILIHFDRLQTVTKLSNKGLILNLAIDGIFELLETLLQMFHQ